MTDTPKLALSVAPFSDHVPRICDWNGEVLCCMGVNESELVSHYEDKADLIVKCVNEHDGFVAACEAAKRTSDLLILNLGSCCGARYRLVEAGVTDALKHLRGLSSEIESALSQVAEKTR